MSIVTTAIANTIAIATMIDTTAGTATQHNIASTPAIAITSIAAAIIATEVLVDEWLLDWHLNARRYHTFEW